MQQRWMIDGPEAAPATVVLAHGAGAPMDSPFMEFFAHGLAADGLRVVRFEFPYMQRRRREGRKPGPDRAEVLAETWRCVLAEVGDAGRTVIGGKSMGGRIASMIADEARVAGLICLGYPFHPAGRPERTRVEHLRELATPCLIAQGERDALGRREEVEGYALSPAIRLHWLPDGDHSFKPRKRSGCTEAQNLDDALRAASGFVRGLDR